MEVTYTDDIIIAGFHALSDPLRIKVLQLLRKQEMCVCDLCDVLQVSQSKLSFHLKNLREADLVYARQEGHWIYYSLNSAQFKVLEHYLAQYHLVNQVLRASSCKDS